MLWTLFSVKLGALLALPLLVSASPIVGPAGSKVNDLQDSSFLKLSDRYDPDSSESHFDWQNRMIAAGKMYRPAPDTITNTSVQQLSAQGWYASVQNVACGFLVGEETEYRNNKDYMCNTFRVYVGATFREMYIITQDEICQGNRVCTAITSISLSVAYLTDFKGIIGPICENLFMDVYRSCNGNVGGSADLEITNGPVTYHGTIENQWYADDSGATCPAHPFGDTVCALRRHP